MTPPERKRGTAWEGWSEYGAYQTVKGLARRSKFSKLFKLPPFRSGAEGWRVWVVRVGGDDGELRPWHYIYVCSIDSYMKGGV